MNTISTKELKAKLDRGDDFKLVMTMGAWAFHAKHIPGSLNVSTSAEATEQLSLDDEIIVYCSNADCVASQTAYHMLTNAGFSSVRRYTGGLEEWEEAGYPLEGDMVGS